MVELGPLLPVCLHDGAVPVEDLAGERVAMLCPDCDQQLLADWRPSFTNLFFDPDLVSDGRRAKHRNRRRR